MSKQKITSISQVIKDRRTALSIQQGYVSLFFRIVFLALVGYLLFTKAFLITQASGVGMFPAIKDGDLIIAFRMQQEYAKNDVVVYTANGATYLGRIAARENDVVTLDESGTLLVNGTAQSGEIMYPTYAKPGYEYPLRVGEGQVFLLGDYRTQTLDSRDFGPISMEQVEGKVITILRRRGL